MQLRERLEEAAAESGRSLAQEVEHRLERSFDDDRLIDVWMGRGTTAAGLFFAMRRIVDKVLRRAKASIPSQDGDCDGTTIEHELNTRRELRAAVEVLMHVYAATEEKRPADPETSIGPYGTWGSGDTARHDAYNWLEWEDDPNLDRAKSTEIDSYWTGTGQPLGDLVQLGLLSEQQGSERRFPGGAPSPLHMPRDNIKRVKRRTS